MLDAEKRLIETAPRGRTKGNSMPNSHIKKPSGLRLKLLRVEIDEVTGIVRLRVRIPVGKRFKEIVVNRELLVDLANFKKLLVSNGAPTNLKFQAEMGALSDPPKGIPEITIVVRSLWDGRRFINCFGEFGPEAQKQERFEYDRSAKTFWKRTTRGDIASYVEGLSEPMANSPTLLFAFLIGLVPSLMLRLSVTDKSFCVALTGQSTTGKSLSTRVTLSVSSEAAEKNLKSMNLSLGRAGQLGGYSGAALTFGDVKASRDEGGKLAKLLQTIVFGIVGGVTRDTLDSAVIVPPEACAGVLSFEKSVLPFFEQSGVEMEDGDRVRILDLQVPNRDEGGIFELDPASAKHLADAVEDTLRNHTGVVLPYWIGYIGGINIEVLRDGVQKFRDEFAEMVGALSPLEARYMECVSWVYAVGRMAIRMQKLKFLDRQTFDSHFELLTVRMLKTFNSGDMELKAEVARVRKALVTAATFPLVEKGERADSEECSNGFRRIEPNGMTVFVRSEFIDTLINQCDRIRVFHQFERAGVLSRSPKDWTWPVSQKGLQRLRYLKFDRDMLERMQ